jgi:hypothetical protein
MALKSGFGVLAFGPALTASVGLACQTTLILTFQGVENMTTGILTEPNAKVVLSIRARRMPREALLARLEGAIRQRPSEQQRRILDHARHIPTRYLRTYTRGVGGRSLVAGVKAHCLECVCWQRVRHSTSPNCVFYLRRPYR